MEIDKLKQYDLVKYIESCTGSRAKKINGNEYRINPCPICGHKDHFTVYRNTNSYSSFNECCKGGTIIDFYMEYYGKDVKESIQELKNELLGGQEMNTIPFKSKEVKPEKEEKPVKVSKLSIDLTTTVNNYITSNPEMDYKYFYSRGLTDEIINKYKLIAGDPEELLKDNKDLLPGLKNISEWSYIVPVQNKGRVVNLILRRNDNKTTYGEKTYNLKNTDTFIFNCDYLKQKGTGIIFITEGIFDALSFETLNYKAIALNSVQMANKLLTEIKDNISTSRRYKYIICGDNDEAGEKLNNKLMQEFKKLNIDCTTFDLKGNKDCNDFLKADKDAFKKEAEKTIKKLLGYIDSYMDRFFINVNDNRNKPAISTGYLQFNKKIGDGIFPGLYCIGGISSLGKTAFTLNVADNIAERGNDVIFFSLEMSKDELISRSLSRRMFLQDNNKYKNCGTVTINRGQLNEDYLEDLDNVATEYGEKIAKNLRIIEGNFDCGVDEIWNTVQEHISITGKKPVVFIDYLQVLKSNGGNDKQETDNNVTKLKRMSREFDIPVIVVSSFNRANYTTPVSFESFKESGSIEYTADVLIGLQLYAIKEIDLSTEKKKFEARAIIKTAKAENPRKVTVVVLKNRNYKANAEQDFYFYPVTNLFQEMGGC